MRRVRMMAGALALCAASAGAAAGQEATPPQAAAVTMAELDLRGAAATGSCPVVETFGPGLFSRPDTYEWRFTTTPLGTTAYWAVSDDFFPFTRQATIVTSRWSHGRWSAPEVAPFSGTHSDIDPYVSPDGLTMFFSSIRPVNGVERADIDLWMMRRTWTGWGAPIHLGAQVNSAGDELYPSIDIWGNLYFASDRDGQFDIYRSRRKLNGTFGPAEKVAGGVNSPDFWEFNPEISWDGSTLLFVGLWHEDGYGAGDLYVSQLRNGLFTPKRNLGPCINTDQDEFHPTLSRDGRSLVFVRRTGEAPSDFFRVRLR